MRGINGFVSSFFYDVCSAINDVNQLFPIQKRLSLANVNKKFFLKGF